MNPGTTEIHRAPSALPLTRALLRLLIALNGLMLGIILLLLFALPNEEWIHRAFDLPSSPDADRLVMALRAVAGLGLLVVPLNHAVFKRLIAIVDTVSDGDPFVAANADRLNTVAWLLLALQLISIVIGAIGDSVSTPAHPVDLDAGFSLNSWLAVLLTFLLARVFAEGTRMRDDLEGTV
jgi:hypothetical protein